MPDLYADGKHLPLALCAFPSPASDSFSLDSPTLSKTLARAGHSSSANTDRFFTPGPLTSSSYQWTPSATLSELASFLPAEPGAPHEPPSVTTPPFEMSNEPDLNMLVGGALAPTPQVSRQQTKSPKPVPGLRLPSFETLGIASPHPDRYGQSGIDGRPTQIPMEPISATSPTQGHVEALKSINLAGDGKDSTPKPLSKSAAGRSVQSPLQQYAATITPPADSAEPDWPTTSPKDSPSADACAPAPSQQQGSGIGGASVSGGHSVGAAVVEAAVETTQPDSGAWSDGAVDVLLKALRTAPRMNNPLRVLSHALPSPSTDGHVFSSIVNAIHDTTPNNPTVWINVFHAVPGRFNLADLPTSPPTTPGPAVGGDDYFTQKVFDSAVAISDYQEQISPLPRSPRPVVPPSSINVSIVERYIPPTNAREFHNIFDVRGPSILVDRLVELSPNNGTLVFVYPNRQGGRTFMHEYLSPILDPMLRSMVVVNGLSSDLSSTLGSMSAVEQLPSHDTLERGVKGLCSTLNQRDSLHTRRPRFNVMYAAKKEVYLPRAVWASSWWAKQEKPRIRDAVTRYAQEAQKKSSNEYVERATTATELIQQLLDGVAKKPYSSGMEPSRGVEVSVFVIRRSQ